MDVLTSNADHARALLTAVARSLRDPRPPCPEGCDRALESALITAPAARDPDLMQKLEAVAGRVLGARTPVGR